MPKRVKTICVDAMRFMLLFFLFLYVAAPLILRVSCGKPWSSAGTILSLKTRLLMKLMLRECDPAQSHAASPTCCLPVRLLLNPSYFPVWDANCFIICLPVFDNNNKKNPSLTEILDMKVRMDDSSWMMFSLDSSWRQTVLHSRISHYCTPVAIDVSFSLR